MLLKDNVAFVYSIIPNSELLWQVLKIIQRYPFLSPYKNIFWDPSLEPSWKDDSNDGSHNILLLKNMADYSSIIPATLIIWSTAYIWQTYKWSCVARLSHVSWNRCSIICHKVSSFAWKKDISITWMTFLPYISSLVSIAKSSHLHDKGDTC